MDVTDVLRDRMHDPSGLQKMVVVSIGLHAALIAAAIVVPASLFPHMSQPPTAVMTISLGGGVGPRNGGLTAMGGRPVQTVTPPEAKKEAVRPPAAKTPEMTMPLPTAKPVKKPAPPSTPVTQAPDEARGRTPTHGAETSAGSAVAETGARGQGFGLSTGGGAGSGSTLDVANFCCPDYLIQMIDRIRSNWVQHPELAGSNVVKFTIHRDGTISDILLETSSGYQNLDLSSQRALFVTKTLNPLPAQFPNPTLTVHLNFQYQR
ncbi:MAG TPA: TonB C-terminal domain-containing protein [Vicinamibacterales bacterium]|nr:TonB C-terminal domain-containing protein [Vicinamibacterales bacterium]